ncbi:MAG: DUF3592 domain-containing protein [Phycisphaerales bacterium]
MGRRPSRRPSLGPGSAGFALLFTAFAVVFEVSFSYSGSASKVREQRASASWPGVQGTVVSARAIERRKRGGPTFRPEIEYDYTVNGTVHRSDRYRVMHNWRTTSLAEELVARHPPGAAVTVYYDPSDPARAVLSPGGAWGDTGTITLFRVIVWALAIGGWVAVAFRVYGKRRAEARQ